jgi:hypothetical protein
MAIVFDANGNLVDTEDNINFFNTGTEQVFPKQGLEPLYPNFGAPMVNDTSFTPDLPYDTLRFVRNKSQPLNPTPLMPNINKVPQLPANRLEGLPSLDLQSLPANMGVANEDDEEQVDSLTGEKKSNGILDAIMSVVMPGYNILKNMGSGKNYQFTDPKGSFRGGVYRMDGVNYSNPNSFGGEFFDRSTGTNRFDRAKDRFRDSRSKKDLFAASRTGAEFANAKKILDFQNQPGNYQTNFMDRPKSERNFTGQAPKGTTAFDTKSGMGRRGFYKGGIASLYGQNN